MIVLRGVAFGRLLNKRAEPSVMGGAPYRRTQVGSPIFSFYYLKTQCVLTLKDCHPATILRAERKLSPPTPSLLEPWHSASYAESTRKKFLFLASGGFVMPL